VHEAARDWEGEGEVYQQGVLGGAVFGGACTWIRSYLDGNIFRQRWIFLVYLFGKGVETGGCFLDGFYLEKVCVWIEIWNWVYLDEGYIWKEVYLVFLFGQGVHTGSAFLDGFYLDRGLFGKGLYLDGNLFGQRCIRMRDIFGQGCIWLGIYLERGVFGWVFLGAEN
jgi:hypothetical protein